MRLWTSYRRPALAGSPWSARHAKVTSCATTTFRRRIRSTSSEDRAPSSIGTWQHPARGNGISLMRPIDSCLSIQRTGASGWEFRSCRAARASGSSLTRTASEVTGSCSTLWRLGSSRSTRPLASGARQASRAGGTCGATRVVASGSLRLRSCRVTARAGSASSLGRSDRSSPLCEVPGSRGRMYGVSERSLTRLEAQNNAEWCDTFCRTYGIVTSEGCSVKDSFAGLDLAAAGFRPLFRAQWLVREPAEARVRSARGWSVLTREEQLDEWEAAWAAVPEGMGFFRPALLEDETIGVLAGYEGDRIVAGAIANRSSTAIGLSNVFAVAGDLESAWEAGAAIAAALWGEMPTVGYESGDSLDAARKGGIKSIGELVVWLY